MTVRRRRKKINITNRKSKSKSKYGWTYFLVNEKARAVKIGKTTQRLDKRLHSLSTQNPHDQFDYRDYRFAFAFDDARLERYFHKHFAIYRANFVPKIGMPERRTKDGKYRHYTLAEALSKSRKKKGSAKSEVNKAIFKEISREQFIFPSVKFIENLAKEAQKPLIDTGINVSRM